MGSGPITITNARPGHAQALPPAPLGRASLSEVRHVDAVITLAEELLILGHAIDDMMNCQSLKKPLTIIPKKSGPKKCSLTTNSIQQKPNRERP